MELEALVECLTRKLHLTLGGHKLAANANAADISSGRRLLVVSLVDTLHTHTKDGHTTRAGYTNE